MTVPYVDADPRLLRAIAHPLRGALLYELFARGAANATSLAEAVHEPVNSVSFHLRQLAKYGLIEEAPELAEDGRQRWWRPSMTEALRVSHKEMSRTPEGQAAFDVFRRHTLGHWQALLERFFSHDDDNSNEVWTSNDVPMQLTDDEAREYSEELFAVMRKWMEHGQGSEPPEGQQRRTYLAMSLMLPHQTDLNR